MKSKSDLWRYELLTTAVYYAFQSFTGSHRLCLFVEWIGDPLNRFVRCFQLRLISESLILACVAVQWLLLTQGSRFM